MEPCGGILGWLSLRYAVDRRVLLWVAIYHVITYISWKYWNDMPWLVALFMMGMCSLWSFLGATITHNSIHVPLFKSGFMNSLFQIALTLTYGWPVSALVPGHNLSHHKFTNTQKDAMRPQRMQYSWNFLNYLMFPAVTAANIAGSDKAYMKEQARLDRPIWRQYIVEAVAFWGVQIILAIADWKRWVWIIVLPQLYAKYQIIAMNILQHDGCPDPFTDSKNHSRNFTGTIVNYMTFNNGLHTTHHNNPGWHWYRLPEEHSKLEMHPNLNQSNILFYFFKAHIYPGIRLDYKGNKVCGRSFVPFVLTSG